MIPQHRLILLRIRLDIGDECVVGLDHEGRPLLQDFPPGILWEEAHTALLASSLVCNAYNGHERLRLWSTALRRLDWFSPSYSRNRYLTWEPIPLVEAI